LTLALFFLISASTSGSSPVDGVEDEPFNAIVPAFLPTVSLPFNKPKKFFLTLKMR
jgi:hypothetical protein